MRATARGGAVHHSRGGSARSFHVDGARIADIAPIVRANLKRDTALMTDEWAAYKEIGTEFASHETVNQVVTRAAHAFGLEPQISHEGPTAEYIRFVIDPEPFSSVYQFIPMISLEEGLRRLSDHLEQER